MVGKGEAHIRMRGAKWRDRARFGFSPELGLILLAAVLLGGFLLVPRATRPVAWPMPHVDFEALEKLAQKNRQRQAARAGLPLSRKVLRVGERLRRLGAALYRGPLPVGVELGYRREGFNDAKLALIETMAPLQASDEGEFFELCAIQSELFVNSVRSFQRAGRVSRDLVELGGDFLASAYVAFTNETGTLPFSDDELKLLYRVRLAHLTDTEDAPGFGPSRDELLAYYGLFIAHPPADPVQRAAARHNAIQAIAAHDAKYPTDFAHGLADLELGVFDRAAASFLAAPSTGSWARLRQNALLEAKRRSGE